jgi:hypothetical protein
VFGGVPLIETKEKNKQHVVRINENTAQLLRGMSQSSIDAAIQLIWRSKCDQAKELKEWREVTNSRSPLDFLKKKGDSLVKKEVL